MTKVVSDEKANSVMQPASLEFYRYAPSQRLKPYVRNFWVIRCSGAISSPRRHRVVPDGCIDLIFMRRSPTEDYRASVVGTMTRPIVEELLSQMDYIGIRFAPGGFRHFFGLPPSELTDWIVPVDDLWSQSGLSERLASCRDLTACLMNLEDELARRFRPEERVLLPPGVLETISACQGNITMSQLGHVTGWSPRHLRRVFHESVGVGPKTFCRIIRFVSVFRVLRWNPRASFLDVALDAGYFDQSHFIHEFEDFYGSSPSKIFENSAL